MLVKHLSSNFDFFFLKEKSFFFFKGIFGVFVFKCPFLFYKKNGDDFSFFFTNSLDFKIFLRNFFSFYNSMFFIYFYKIKIRGLGYRFRFICKRLVRVFMGTVNYIYIHFPEDILFRLRRRRLILASFNLELLRKVFFNILLLKDMVPYDFRGIYYPRRIILMKPGKKKF
jgi:hypothetical protein